MTKRLKIDTRMRSTRRFPLRYDIGSGLCSIVLCCVLFVLTLSRMRYCRRPTLVLMGCLVRRSVGRSVGLRGGSVCVCSRAGTWCFGICLFGGFGIGQPPQSFLCLSGAWHLPRQGCQEPLTECCIVHCPLVAACEVTFFLGVFALCAL